MRAYPQRCRGHLAPGRGGPVFRLQRAGRQLHGHLGRELLARKQTTDANGLVEFETIYPGWYPGRTVHIHFKAYTDEETFVTSQMYLPDDVSDTVFLTEPYAARGPRGTTNANDRLLDGVSDDEALMGVVTQDGDGYMVALTIGVAR